jgi:2,3-bisphosphoglycerate-dependent phosphoglycerate mutase
MKRILLILIVICISSGSSAQEAENDISVYYLIRHAEKDRSDKTNKNPNLKQKGLARALKWAEVFKDVVFDELYTTRYNRTQQTAEPTAFKQKLQLSFYNPSHLDMVSFKDKTKGKTVLIVGHSNTTPDFANKLLGKEIYESMDDTDNAGLYIITIIKGVATSARLSVN